MTQVGGREIGREGERGTCFLKLRMLGGDGEGEGWGEVGLASAMRAFDRVWAGVTHGFWARAGKHKTH